MWVYLFFQFPTPTPWLNSNTFGVFFVCLDILIACLICTLMWFCVYPAWTFLSILCLWTLVCFLYSTSVSSSLILFILLFTVLFRLSLFHSSFMLLPIFASFSPPPMLQYFLLPHLLVHQCCILLSLIYYKAHLLS